MANLNIITKQVISWINESNTDFNLELGEKKLYLVVEWTDGASLFIEDYFNFMNELIMVYCDLDEDTDEEKVIWFNKLFGIGSEWYNLAKEQLLDNLFSAVADACDTESVDLNKMENEVNI